MRLTVFNTGIYRLLIHLLVRLAEKTPLGGDIHMQNTTTQNSKLPFSCRMLCVSLGGASIMLTLIFSLYYVDYISTEVAAWATVGVFVMAAVYESFLLSLVAMYMLKRLKEDAEVS